MIRIAPRAAAAVSTAVTEHDPEIGYRYLPNLRVAVPHERGQYTVVTNRDGLRSSHEYDPCIPGGTTRLLLIGDSLTAGDGVNNAERFSDRLEARCPNLEVVNCGLPGSGTDQQLLLLRRVSSRMDYDALLICPMVENIRRNVARYRLAVERPTGQMLAVPKPFFTLEADGLQLHNVPVQNETLPVEALSRDELPYVDFGGLKASLRVRRFINTHVRQMKSWAIQAAQFQPHPEYFHSGTPEWRLMAALLREMVTVASGRPVIIAPLPYYIHIEYLSTANYLPRFLELAQPSVYILDVLPYFWRLPSVDRLRCRYQDDPHYTPFAHEIVGEAVGHALTQLGYLDPDTLPPLPPDGVTRFWQAAVPPPARHG